MVVRHTARCGTGHGCCVAVCDAGEVGGDRAHVVVDVVPYDPGWPLRFRRTRDQIRQVLPGAVIEHVGSTSVPGLSSKDTIDVAVGVEDVDAALTPGVVAALAGLGFEHRPESFADNPDHAFLHRSVAGHRTDHVHLMRLDSPTYTDRLIFRDYLRASPAVVAEYQEIKLHLAAELADRRGEYVDRKATIVGSMMRDARAWAAQRVP